MPCDGCRTSSREKKPTATSSCMCLSVLHKIRFYAQIRLELGSPTAACFSDKSNVAKRSLGDREKGCLDRLIAVWDLACRHRISLPQLSAVHTACPFSVETGSSGVPQGMLAKHLRRGLLSCTRRMAGFDPPFVCGGGGGWRSERTVLMREDTLGRASWAWLVRQRMGFPDS